jgi:hypothetical protein
LLLEVDTAVWGTAFSVVESVDLEIKGIACKRSLIVRAASARTESMYSFSGSFWPAVVRQMAISTHGPAAALISSLVLPLSDFVPPMSLAFVSTPLLSSVALMTASSPRAQATFYSSNPLRFSYTGYF